MAQRFGPIETLLIPSQTTASKGKHGDNEREGQSGRPVDRTRPEWDRASIGEPSQTAVLEIRGGLGYAIGTAASATVNIADNSDVPYISIAVTAGPAVESGTAGTFRVTTTGTGTGNISVLYTVTAWEHANAKGDTALGDSCNSGICSCLNPPCL